MDLFGRKWRQQEKEEQAARERARAVARWEEEFAEEQARRDAYAAAERALVDEFDGLLYWHLEQLLPPSAPLADQVDRVLDLGVPVHAAEIRDRVRAGVKKHLQPGDWLLGAAFQEKMTVKDNGFAKPRRWVVVADRGFVMAVGSNVFFARPEQVTATVQHSVKRLSTGPSPWLYWSIHCGSFDLTNDITYGHEDQLHPRRLKNSVAQGLRIQEQLRSGRRRRPDA